MGHRTSRGTRRRAFGTLLGLLSAGPAVAQPPAAPPRPLSVFESTPAAPPASNPGVPCAPCERPTELPPLLPVPQPGPTPPQPKAPRGPVAEYDHGHLYLPERAPEVARAPDPPCGPDGRFWITTALELGHTKAVSVPALVRLGSATGPIILGDEQLTTPSRAGLGLAGGLWLDARHTHGVDASFYYLAEGGSDTNVYMARTPLALPTADGGFFPLSDPAAGTFGVYQLELRTRFTSADVNVRENLLCGETTRVDGLFGYRYGYVGERFTAFGKRLGADGEVVRFRDDAAAANHFHGGQIGLATEHRMGRWFLDATGKVAFGTVFTDTSLDGKFRLNGTVIPAGFYARPGLNGDREHTRYAVMPTVGVTLGRQVGDHGRVFVGYNFLYLNHVTRAGDVIDPLPPVVASDPLRINPVGVNRRDATTSDFWAQSVSLGMEWRY